MMASVVPFAYVIPPIQSRFERVGGGVGNDVGGSIAVVVGAALVCVGVEYAAGLQADSTIKATNKNL
jgi:hypothetical protein